MTKTADSDRCVACDYCAEDAPLVDGRAVYPRRPDIADKLFYKCTPCDAWVGCHAGTTMPLGRLADASLRTAKTRAHDAFDPIWKGDASRHPAMTRADAYRWLACELGIPRKECHIGMFDLALCERAVDVSAAYLQALDAAPAGP